VAADEEAVEGAGQLYKDIVHMYKRGKFDIRWGFDSRSADWISADGKNIQKKTVDWIIETLNNNSDIKQRMIKDLRLTGADRWEDFIADLRSGLENFATIIPKSGTY
jgi:hypothetical protein